jgi:hypothetical protein
MPTAKKAFISRLLKNKDAEYISENFSYVVDMFERETQTEVEKAQENIISEQLETTIDRPQVIEEQANFNNEIEREATSDGVNGYLNEMKKISKSKFAR